MPRIITVLFAPMLHKWNVGHGGWLRQSSKDQGCTERGRTTIEQLDPVLIRQFRDKMNDDYHYIMHKYCDVNGKNLWNVICSAMDWIEVAVDGIPTIQLANKNPNIASLNLMQLICALDLVVQSVKQLCRVFDQRYPYGNDHSLFEDKKTDDDYFKHIRAMFGVHPVNLKDDEERYYASWSTPHLKADFSVIVYSNQVGKEDQIYAIRIEDLFEYAGIRYGILRTLISHVESDYQLHLKQWMSQKIPDGLTIKEQIITLLRENEQRFGRGEAYWYQLGQLKQLFDVNESFFEHSHRAMIPAYKDALKIVVDEIQSNLQHMNVEELRSYNILNPFEEIPHSYDKGKLLTYLHNPDSDINARTLAEYALGAMVKHGVLPKAAMDYEQEELLLFLSAWEWERNRDRNHNRN
jgi:hypothetical protein